MLTGAYKNTDNFDLTDFRRYLPTFQPENFPKNIKLVEKLEEIAAKKGRTASEPTLAWIIPQAFIAIPGTRKIKYLDSKFFCCYLVDT
jgi:aryl-alcohol dehydrogenase-like predicted oxidoreductase